MGDYDNLKSGLKSGECGYAACAVGWCPVFFPKSFYYNDIGDIYLNKKEEVGANGYAAMNYFCLDEQQFRYLFLPEEYNFEELTNPLAVANRILKLISY